MDCGKCIRDFSMQVACFPHQDYGFPTYRQQNCEGCICTAQLCRNYLIINPECIHYHECSTDMSDGLLNLQKSANRGSAEASQVRQVVRRGMLTESET
ncbi:hypothetical protein HOLleu_00800 [Holothuria leucospilota]|uniref:Uncharacterized protein n=1 Tax=Holothuria leucospilota TaxID=206669 RepID=A0A9Q1CP41_HOLLE|nr:hypothetical protein HOLleu_00800 [Holothuria leucospilota]